MEQRGSSQQRPRRTRVLLAGALGLSLLGSGLAGCQPQQGDHRTAPLNEEQSQSSSALPQPTLSSPAPGGGSDSPNPTVGASQDSASSGGGQGGQSGQSGQRGTTAPVTQHLEPGFYSFPIYDGALNCEVGTSSAPFADCWADFTTTWKEHSGDHRQVKRAQFFTGPARIEVTGDAEHPQRAYTPVQAGGSVAVGSVIVSWPSPDEITLTPNGQDMFRIGPDYYSAN